MTHVPKTDQYDGTIICLWTVKHNILHKNIKCYKKKTDEIF